MKNLNYTVGWFIALVSLAEGVAQMASATQELERIEVVSTGTRTDRLAADLPIRTELLSPEIFRATGAGDLSMALAYLPGARVDTTCQNCGSTELKLLGLGAGYNQLLFDGQPLFTGLASVYGLEHIPTALIERVEVVKGGASSLYGPGAVAGVVNIISREPLVNQWVTEGRAESMKGGAVFSGLALRDWVDVRQRAAATLFVQYRKSDAVDLNADGFSDIAEKEFSTMGTQLWLSPLKGGRLLGSYAYTSEERRGGDRLDLPGHESQIAESLEHRWHRGGLYWEQDISPDLFVRVGGSISHVDRDSYYGGVGAVLLPGQEGFDADIYAGAVDDARLLYGFTESRRTYLDSLFTRRYGGQVISMGIQYTRDSVFDEKRDDLGRSLRSDGGLAQQVGEDPIADASFTNHGLFVQHEWDPSYAWTVITGLRADKHSLLDDWVWSPRAAVRYSLSSEWTLRTSLSTGFRAPDVFDEDFHIEILDEPTRTRNADGLNEERSTSWAGGFIWTPAFAENRLQVDVEFFHTSIRDSFNVSDIVFMDVDGNAFKVRENAGRSRVRGVEANMLYRIGSHWSAEFGINFTDARFDEEQEVLEGIFEDRFIAAPRWSGLLTLNYENEDWLDLFLGLVYTGPMIVVNEAESFLNRDTGHFFAVDLSATRHIDLGRTAGAPHLDITVGVRNLLDQRQGDLPSGPERDAGYAYGPRFPRSFFLSGSLVF